MSMFDDLLNAARGKEQVTQPEPEISSKKKGGKRSHPDYRQTTIYINKQLEKKMKAAFLEDGIEDFSQWIEEQIEEWLQERNEDRNSSG